jgi:RNA polymerase sigma factor (sigma-70 family)
VLRIVSALNTAGRADNLMTTQTTTRLIDDLRDPANPPAWDEFDRRYRPVITGLGRALALNGDEAEELAQRTLGEFAVALREGRYQRERGRLSSWLLGIGRNIALDIRRRRERHRGAGADSMIAGMPAELSDTEHLTHVWQRERERAILSRAMDMLRESTRTEERTLRAFELFALRGVSAPEVARECAMGVDAVYVIKNRLTARLRELVREITLAYDEDK